MSEKLIDVLVVEDSEIDRMVIRRSLSDFSDIRIHGVANLTEAAVSLERRAFDLILLDLSLPESEGLETLTRLRAQAPRTPCVVLTGANDDRLGVKALQAGAQDYLVKSQPIHLARPIRHAVERSRIHAALEQSEERFRLLVEGARDHAIYLLDSEGNVESWNPGAERIFGYTAEEVAGRNHAMLFSQKDQQLGLPDQLLRQARFRGKLEDEGWRLRKNQTPFWSNGILTPLFGERGGIKGFSSVCRDLTEKKRAADNLNRQLLLANFTAEINAIVAHGGDLASMLDRCAESLVKHLDGVFAGIWIHHQAEQVVELQASAGINSQLNGPYRKIPLQERLIGTIASQRLPMIINENLLNHPQLGEPEWAHREGIVSFAGYPLIVEGNLTGVLALFGGHALEDNVLKTIASIADVIAVGVKRWQDAELLRESQQLFRSVVDHAHDGIITIDEQGIIQTINRSAQQMLGYDEQEVIGRHVRVFMPESDSSTHDNYISDYLRTGKRKVIGIGREVVCLRKDGSCFPVELAVGEFELNGGRHFTGVIRDISHRKQAEESQARLVAVLEASPDLVGLADVHGCFTFMNQAGRKLLNLASDENLADLKIVDVYPESNEIEQVLTNVVQTGLWSGETKMAARPPIGPTDVSAKEKGAREFPASVVIIAHKSAAGAVQFFSMVARDLTEYRQLEMQVRQSQKMEAIGLLAGGIAHDFNNLLTIITGYSEVLLTLMAADDSRRMHVDAIKRAGERASTLTRQLLAFARRQVIAPQVIDVNDTVRETEKMLRRLIGEDIQLVTSLPGDVYNIKMDPGELDQILINLAVNARDAMPHGGTLQISTKNIDRDANFQKLHPEVHPGRYVMLQLSDNGTGIAHGIQERIFEPFFTSKEIGKGTGLGLAVVHGIVKQNGGHLTLQSDPGVGSTFSFFFPAHEQAPAKSTPTDAALVPTGKERILVIEDDESVRAYILLSLQRQGYHVQCADNGPHALEIFAQRADEIDLVVTDVVMPGMGGRAVAESMLSRRPDLKVLFLSGYTDDAVVRHGIVTSEVAFLQKPFSPSALGNKVRQILDDE